MDSSRRTSLGILLMVAFAAIAPIMDTFAKLIGDNLAVALVAASRFVIQAAILLPIAAFMGWLHRPRNTEIGLHILRATLLFVATGFFFLALQFMPMADAISIFFVEPFILILLGSLLLGEQIGPRRYIACIIGFSGALLIIQPSFEEFGIIAAAPLGTALLFALYLILTRRMATRMHPIAMQSYTGLAALVVALPVLWLFDGTGIPQLDPSWPEARELRFILALGLTATLSHVCISFALSLAPASLLAPLQYLEIVSATILGFYVFGDLPDVYTFSGIALIVISGLYVFIRERQLERKNPGQA